MPSKVLEKVIEEEEERTYSEDDSPELPPPDVVAYNELRSCADLFRMYSQNILEIQPEFQREVVWSGPKQTRFIDSLVKQLPIPSMCFSLDPKTQKWKVIDGLQRMWSIKRFLSGEDWTLSNLKDIDPKLSGQPVSRFVDTNSELHPYYTRVENLSLPITVIRCDYSKRSHNNYLFTIFHRLNTGGMGLNNQEIRNCIYGGPFNDLLKELDSNRSWMKINRMEAGGRYRFTKQELILRFLTFHDKHRQYSGRLARFLNEYMDDHRDPGPEFLDEKRKLFQRTIDVVHVKVFGGKAPQQHSVSILESVLVGVARNLDYLESLPVARVVAMYDRLLNSEKFSVDSLSEGLSSREKVIDRLSAAERVFAGK